MMNYENLTNIVKEIKEKINFKPEIALVLGSGLGDYAEGIEKVKTLNYSEIEGFPRSTVNGHKGQFVFGYIEKVPVVIMQGRVHYYEGYDIEEVVLPIRVMGLLGAKALFLTNAAGAVNHSFSPGDFMVIEDQISSFLPSPLRGKNMEELGVRFPDMSEIYNITLRTKINEAAEDLKLKLKQGVYIQLPGPNFETPAEIRMCRVLGGDAVGMSTACEAIVANHMGMKVCGISCISNLCSGMTDNPLSAEEVYETADRVAPDFKRLITKSILYISRVI